MEDQTLASEMLSEIKVQNKRLFKALVIVIVFWFVTIGVLLGAFFWYFSLPIEETTVEQAVEGDANSMIGIGDSYGEYTEGYEETQSSSGS